MSDTWKTARLGDVCRIIPGYAFKSSDWQLQGIPVVKIKNIKADNTVDLSDVDCVPNTLLKPKLQKFVLKDGDVLLAMTGATAGKVGKIRTTQPIFLNQRVAKIDPVEADRNFIWSVVSSEEYQRKFFLLADGAAQPNMSGSQIEGLEIPLPPLPVQRRIAGILSAYDELIENSQRRIRLLEDMARALYREWFVHFRFPGHESVPRLPSALGDIPQGWEVKPLASLVDFAKGRKPAETRLKPLPGDVKLLLIGSLHGGEAVFSSPAKLVLAEVRDTIMVMDGASSCEVTIGSSGAVGSTLGRFRTTRPDIFSPHALYRFLESKAEEFKSKNIGAAIPHANRDYILTQPVALPPKTVASWFDAQLEPIQCTIETLKNQIQNLRRTRDLLLPRLLSGQVALAAAAN